MNLQATIESYSQIPHQIVWQDDIQTQSIDVSINLTLILPFTAEVLVKDENKTLFAVLHKNLVIESQNHVPEIGYFPFSRWSFSKIQNIDTLGKLLFAITPVISHNLECFKL